MLLPYLVLLAAQGRTGPGYVPDPAKVVAYEANLRAIAPRYSLQVLDSHLERIKSLGVNVLWLMPIQPVGKVRSAGGLGSPYATRDLESVNPEFGDEHDLQALVARAHRLHMAVILDWVADHTSWDSPWISQHPDWYLHDAEGRIEPPPGTNWNDVAGLDYRSEPMRRQMIEAMKSWISRDDVDGFRCDAADRIPIDFWKEDIETLRASTPKRLLMLGEGARGEDYAAGFDLTYGWDFNSKLRAVFGGQSAKGIAGAMAYEMRNVPEGGRTLRYITNHDLSAWDGSLPDFYKTPNGIRSAFAITVLYGGTPLIYCGQEVGWQGRIPIFENTSIDWDGNPSEAQWLTGLLGLRSEHPAIQMGRTDDHSDADVALFTRTASSEQVLVAANVRGHDSEVRVPRDLQGVWIDAETKQAASVGATLNLPPYGYKIFFKKANHRS